MKFSIVSYLDNAATQHIRSIQHDLSDLTGSKESLTSWEPHVTVGDGVVAQGNSLSNLQQELTEIAQSTQPFAINISGIKSFDSRPIGKGEKSTPYALFAAVKVSEELEQLKQKVEVATKNYDKWYIMPKPFQPHVTLAFRDLDKEGYEKGLDYLADTSIELASEVNHISLVEKGEDSDDEFLRLNFING